MAVAAAAAAVPRACLSVCPRRCCASPSCGHACHYRDDHHSCRPLARLVSRRRPAGAQLAPHLLRSPAPALSIAPAATGGPGRPFDEQGVAPPGSSETYFSPSATDTPVRGAASLQDENERCQLGCTLLRVPPSPRVMAGGGAALGVGAIACPPCPLSSRLPGSARQRTNFLKNVNDSLYCLSAALWSIPASPGSAPARPCVHRWGSSHYRTARCCVSLWWLTPSHPWSVHGLPSWQAGPQACVPMGCLPALARARWMGRQIPAASVACMHVHRRPTAIISMFSTVTMLASLDSKR